VNVKGQSYCMASSQYIKENSRIGVVLLELYIRVDQLLACQTCSCGRTN
jgi:hypothetical protein